MLLLFYNLLFPVGFILYLPVFLHKLIKRGGAGHRFGERFGCFSREQKESLRTLHAPIWIHAVSVGEVVAACSFIRAWQERDPGIDIVLSTTTTTGHAMAEAKLPRGVCLIYSPLDFYPFVRRVLALTKPRMLVIFEVEFWPNLVLLAAHRGIPVVLANGRMSDRSAAGYAKHRRLVGGIFSAFTCFCVQSAADAERLRKVVAGGTPVHVCNTMKFDQTPDSTGADRQALLNETFGPPPRLVWTAASTHPGEEALVADVFTALRRDFPQLRLILVPRHHERTAEVERVLVARDLEYRLLIGGNAATQAPVLVVNTTGEMMNFLAASDLVFVGKSLAGNEGGHNIIEPAIFGKAIIHGPNMQNFRLVADVFRQAGAVCEVADDEGLLPALRTLCADEERRAELGARARRVVDQQRGAVAQTLDIFQDIVGTSRSANVASPPAAPDSTTPAGIP